jgi:alkanesulfonate monooxygenase SsuD/methylene tetrahydromethanopterin reductase-like flavin-dependent oxidoreductase (luciferase family)
VTAPARALGLVLPTRTGVGEQVSFAALLEIARAAEWAGADSLWVGDSLFARPRYDPLTVLASVAAVTSRCLLGTAVLVAPMWHPLLLARAVATLDAASGGRLVVGLGAGPSHGAAQKEYAALGVPSGDRLGRLTEIVDACRAVWTGTPAAHAGERWSFRNVRIMPATVAPGGPSVVLGGAGPRTRAFAGARFDGWLPVGVSPAQVASGLADVRAAAAGAGRDPASVGCTVYLSVAVDDDEARAERTARRSLEEYYGAPWAAIGGLQDVVSGRAEKVAAAVQSYYASGAERVALRCCGPDPVGQWEAVRGELPDAVRVNRGSR